MKIKKFHMDSIYSYFCYRHSCLFSKNLEQQKPKEELTQSF